MATALAGSVSCAAVLHGVDVRPLSALVVPVVLLWGAAVVGAVPKCHPRSGWVLLVAALVVRAPLVGTPPHLSDDLYRYLFEGLALAAGHNPFVSAPATLEGVDDALRALVNHPDVTTVYPPLALLWFRFVALIGSSAGVQALTALTDATVPVALRIATRRSWPAWVYALHPLPVLESACGGHIDVPAVALAVAGLAAWRRGYLGAGWAGFVGASLVKLFPVLVLPALLRRVSPAHAAAWAAAAFGVTLVLALPVLSAGPDLLQGIGAYSTRWSFNGFVFPWLEPLLGDATRPVLLTVGASLVAYALARHRDPGAVWAVAGGAFVLLSPTVHPWYALWAMVPALACGRMGWAVAAVPLMMSYTVLLALDPDTGTWSEAPWLWWVTWPPVLAALVFYRNEPRATAP